ncbi:ABC transporter permease [candidate division KSB1 bacterium]|nr:ABC transporter permease [candidate division KSB1 bacterium]
MIWWYCLKEGWDGLRRAKMAALITSLTMAGALIVLGIFGLFTFNLTKLVETLRARIEVEVFVDMGKSEADIKELRRAMEKLSGITSVRYVSREEAVEIFRREFGKEFIDLLKANPLPPSFHVTLQKSHQNSEAAQRLANQLQALPGVDEVVYRRDLVKLMDKYVGFAIAIDALVGLVIGLGAFFVVINHVRLVVFAKRRVLETMQLVGANRTFITLPFLLQGFVHGLIGGGLAILFFHLAFRFVLLPYHELLALPAQFYPALGVFGILLGLLAAYIGVRRFVD